MSLILAQSFMKQLKRLPQKEQGVVSRTVLDLQMDPTAASAVSVGTARKVGKPCR